MKDFLSNLIPQTKIYLSSIIGMLVMFWEWYLSDGHSQITKVLATLIPLATLIYIILGINERRINNTINRKKIKR